MYRWVELRANNFVCEGKNAFAIWEEHLYSENVDSF